VAAGDPGVQLPVDHHLLDGGGQTSPKSLAACWVVKTSRSTVMPVLLVVDFKSVFQVSCPTEANEIFVLNHLFNYR